ncbi:CWF19-like protein 2 -like protein [Toxocara canis]|uniref:CWF19-like protein 2-like protein n=1 Tax=Toxocara canis TaxID=6265 RepID=A0A0B2V0Q4_TOXCA|nr:CWF19-like protein 2 -like protein [Toxocara canis]
MKRGGVFRRPDEDVDYGNRVVHAKPIDERFRRKLGSLGAGKDFVMGSEKSQKELCGNRNFEEVSSCSGVLSQDERNKISAKILKAEMKGNKELADRLRKKFEGSEEPCSSGERVHLLMKTDKRSGITMPVSMGSRSQKALKTSDGKYSLGSIEAEYRSEMSLRDMAAEERTTSADDQLALFSRAAKAAAERKTDDDWLVDDAMMSLKRRRKHEERDEAKKRHKAVKGLKKGMRGENWCCGIAVVEANSVEEAMMLRNCLFGTTGPALSSDPHRWKAAAERKTDDDWLVDDAMMSLKRRRKHEERDEAKKRHKAVKGLISVLFTLFVFIFLLNTLIEEVFFTNC